MITEELKKITDWLVSSGDMCFLAPAYDDDISRFEYINKITFPEQYKEWLMFSDGGEIFLPAGVQFYGVSHKPIIEVGDENIPFDECIAIGSLSNGDPIIFKNGYEEIAIFNKEANRIEKDEVFENFFGFLNEIESILDIEI
jgi:hypothetical protein